MPVTTKTPAPPNSPAEPSLRQVLTGPSKNPEEELRGVEQETAQIGQRLFEQYRASQAVSSPEQVLRSVEGFLAALPPKERERVEATLNRRAELENARGPLGDLTVNPELTNKLRKLVASKGWLPGQGNGAPAQAGSRIFVTNSNGKEAQAIGNNVVISSGLLESTSPGGVLMEVAGTVCHERVHVHDDHPVKKQLADLLIHHHLGKSSAADQLLSGVSKQLEFAADAGAESCLRGGVRARLLNEGPFAKPDPPEKLSPHPTNKERLEHLERLARLNGLPPVPTLSPSSPEAEALRVAAVRSIEERRAKALGELTDGLVTINLAGPPLTKAQREARQTLVEQGITVSMVVENSGDKRLFELDFNTNNVRSREALGGNYPLHVEGNVITLVISQPLAQGIGAAELEQLTYQRNTAQGNLVSSVQVKPEGGHTRRIKMAVNSPGGTLNFPDVNPSKEGPLHLLSRYGISHEPRTAPSAAPSTFTH